MCRAAAVKGIVVVYVSINLSIKTVEASHACLSDRMCYELHKTVLRLLSTLDSMSSSLQVSSRSITRSWSVSSVGWVGVEHGPKEVCVWWYSVSCLLPQSYTDMEGCSASHRQHGKDPWPPGAGLEHQRSRIPCPPQVPPCIHPWSYA